LVWCSCSSIFGRDKFVATVPRKTRSGKSDVPYKLSQDYDWLLIYTKNSIRSDKLFQRTVERKYYKSDDYPNDEWRLTDLTTQRTIEERKNSNFTLINPKNGNEYPVNPNRCWSVTKDTVKGFLDEGKIVFPGDYDFFNIQTPYMRVFKSEEIEKNGEDFNKTYVSTEFINKTMDIMLKDVVNKKGTDDMVTLFGEKIFSYPKNELLLQKIIEYCTSEGDIVLDFFLGSGTTAAVAHKMGRQYIGIEQMDYINDVTVERMKKVIEGEQGGISKDVDWIGGGSFVYAELMELNKQFEREINVVKTTEQLRSVIKVIKEYSFMNYNVNLERLEIHDDAFKNLSLKDQKTILIETLDKNQLYLSYSEIEDATNNVSKNVKEFNWSFYKQKGDDHYE